MIYAPMSSKIRFGLNYVCVKIVFFHVCLSCRADYYYYWLMVINLAVMYNLFMVIGRSVFWELDNLFPLVGDSDTFFGPKNPTQFSFASLD